MNTENVNTDEKILDTTEVVETTETSQRDQIAAALDATVTDQPAVDEPKPDAEVEVYTPKFSGYRADEREKLSTLPVDVQKIIDSREEKFFQGVEQYKVKAQTASNIEAILQPDAEILKQFGYNTPESYVSRLVTVERQLRDPDPMTRIRALQGIAADYGLDLGQLSEVQFDPHAHQLQQRVAQYETERTLSQASSQSAETEQLNSMIEEFAQTHEHFETVKTAMGKLLEAGQATDLESAYEKAIRLDDGLFKQLQAKQLEDIQKANLLKANQAAKTAKSAAVSIKGSPSGQKPISAAKTDREALELAFAEHCL